MCLFRKLATSLKFSPVEKKREGGNFYDKIRQHVRQFCKLRDENKKYKSRFLGKKKKLHHLIYIRHLGLWYFSILPPLQAQIVLIIFGQQHTLRQATVNLVIMWEWRLLNWPPGPTQAQKPPAEATAQFVMECFTWYARRTGQREWPLA